MSGNRSPFLSFLNRIRGLTPLRDEDRDSISNFPSDDQRQRHEEPLRRDLDKIPAWNLDHLEQEFLDHGFGGHAVPIYSKTEDGLRDSGWAEIPGGGVDIGSGQSGSVKLAYKLSESRVELTQRHLCALKVQPQEVRRLTGRDYKMFWKEVSILRSCVHPHVVDYFSHFFVQRQSEGRSFMQLVILLEYASAGTLYQEVRRYSEGHIRETGARFYALQICSGLQYLHSKAILHNDLHDLNVLLKYRPDGSKSCLICDFGQCMIADPGSSPIFKKDVHSVCKLIELMLLGEEHEPRPLSPDAMQLLTRSRSGMWAVPDTIHELVQQFHWFSGPSVPPFPKPPSPILQPDVVQDIGYRSPRTPSPGWSLADRTKRRVRDMVSPLLPAPRTPVHLQSGHLESGNAPSTPVTPATDRTPAVRMSESPTTPTRRPDASGTSVRRRIDFNSSPTASQSPIAPSTPRPEADESLGSRMRRSASDAAARLAALSPRHRGSYELRHDADDKGQEQFRRRRDSGSK